MIAIALILKRGNFATVTRGSTHSTHEIFVGTLKNCKNQQNGLERVKTIRLVVWIDNNIM